MIAPRAELIAVLRQFNPWWDGNRVPELPRWRRAAFREVETWLSAPPAPRALLLSGARQVGKTTILLQAIEELLAKGVPATSILYATFDHPLLKLIGLDGLMRLWKEYEPSARDVEYVLLDEIQYAKDWQTWIKHQVTFEPKRRIAVTGSATPLIVEGQESGPGRWHTVRLAPLSFYEFLQIKRLPTPKLPDVTSLHEVSLKVAQAVGEVAIRMGVSRPCAFSSFQHNNDSTRLTELIRRMRWEPVYLPLVAM